MSEYKAVAPKDLKPGMKTEHFEVMSEPQEVELVFGGEEVTGRRVAIRWLDGSASERFWPWDVCDKPMVRVKVEKKRKFVVWARYEVDSTDDAEKVAADELAQGSALSDVEVFSEGGTRLLATAKTA